MRARCHLRELRGDRTLASIGHATKISTPILSELERGRRLPTDREQRQLQTFYKAPLAALWALDGPYLIVDADAQRAPQEAA